MMLGFKAPHLSPAVMSLFPRRMELKGRQWPGDASQRDAGINNSSKSLHRATKLCLPAKVLRHLGRLQANLKPQNPAPSFV